LIEEPEIAIVGGGIGGAALATALARGGLSVAVLERDVHHIDRVRGEFVAPWGVAEAAHLGLLDILQGTGGSYVTQGINYDETVQPDRAEASARDLRTLHTIGTGPLCALHAAMCEALCMAAAAAGAMVLRGIKNIAVAAGEPPSIRFEHNDQSIAWRGRRTEFHRPAPARLRRTPGSTT
jgi:2-polyprenyl-6-methoxyphenol hydroxylase-like FAD-dependent oxidoreductase